MKKLLLIAFIALLSVPAFAAETAAAPAAAQAAAPAAAPAAAAETWTNVSIMDGNCVQKAEIKANPDAHSTVCALKCEQGGYGILTSDGTYLKFDDAGNKKALAALKATKKTDHLRVDVTGTKEGDSIKVKTLKMV